MNAEYLIDPCDKVDVHNSMWLGQEVNTSNKLTA
jgi:hypothetical protein